MSWPAATPRRAGDNEAATRAERRIHRDQRRPTGDLGHRNAAHVDGHPGDRLDADHGLTKTLQSADPPPSIPQLQRVAHVQSAPHEGASGDRSDPGEGEDPVNP